MELRCAYCHDTLGRIRARCRGCATLLHTDCWNLAGTCPTLGCLERAAQPHARNRPRTGIRALFAGAWLVLAGLGISALLIATGRASSDEIIVLGSSRAPLTSSQSIQLAEINAEIATARHWSWRADAAAQASDDRAEAAALSSALRLYAEIDESLQALHGVGASTNRWHFPTYPVGVLELQGQVSGEARVHAQRAWSLGRESLPDVSSLDLSTLPAPGPSDLELGASLAHVTSTLGVESDPPFGREPGSPNQDQVFTWFDTDERLGQLVFMYRSGTIGGLPFERSRAKAYGVLGPATLATEILATWGEPESSSTDTAGWNVARRLRCQVNEACVELAFDNGALVQAVVNAPGWCNSHTHDPGE